MMMMWVGGCEQDRGVLWGVIMKTGVEFCRYVFRHANIHQFKSGRGRVFYRDPVDTFNSIRCWLNLCC